jgi:hypothetical protein
MPIGPQPVRTVSPSPDSIAARYERRMMVCIGFMAIAFVNLIPFLLLHAIYQGGDAVNGKVEAGQYFLCDPPNCIQVSHSVFNLSLWHTRSFIVTHLLGMIATAYYYYLSQKWDALQDDT